MGVLEKVLSSREFELEDDVIIGFNDYFDEQCRNYNTFSLDDEDIPALQRFVQLLSDNDGNISVYVCTYGDVYEDNQGLKSTYADCIWLDTILTISDIERIILESQVPDPSDISYIGDCNEIERKKVWLIKQTNEGTPQVIELYDRKHIGRMLRLYWD